MKAKIPNCRMTSHKFFINPGYIALSDSRFRVLFDAIVSVTDVYGDLPADPASLATLAPSEKLTPEQVEQALDEFLANRLIVRYRAGVNAYLHVMESVNKPTDKPDYPLPPGLRAVREKEKSRSAKHDILDEAGNKCDVDGDPLDGQNPRTAPDWFCLDMSERVYACSDENIHVRTCSTNRKEDKEKETNVSLSSDKGNDACAGGGVGAPPPHATEEEEEVSPEQLAAIRKEIQEQFDNDHER